MNLDKINLSLYDLVGYLLPGFVFLGVLSVAEATFASSRLITVQSINSNIVVFVAVAYYLGHFCHTVGSSLNKISGWTRARLGLAALCVAPMEPTLIQVVEEEVCAAYNLRSDQLGSSDATREFNCYLLADNWTLVEGSTGERDTFQAREGFFKASSFSFGVAGIVFGLSLLKSGATINQTMQQSVKVTLPISLVACGFCLIVAFVFARRYIYFSCLRRNQTRLLFLASRRKQLSSSP